jgi:hypothetical protein
LRRLRACERLDELLEYPAAVLIVVELVEAGTGGREQYDIAGGRGLGCACQGISKVPASTIFTTPASWRSIFSAAEPIV